MTNAIDAEFVKFVATALKMPESEITDLTPFNNPTRKNTTYLLTRVIEEEGKKYEQVLEIGVAVTLYVQGPKELKL